MMKLTRNLMGTLAAVLLLAGSLLPFDSALARTAGRQDACDSTAPDYPNCLVENYAESNGPDGGNSLSNPTPLPNGPFSGILGVVGGEDTRDVFSFHFDGGAFGMQVECAPGACEELNLKILADLYLASDTSSRIAQAHSPSPDGDAYISSLAAGDYVLDVYATSDEDPPYLVSFSSSGQNGLQTFLVNDVHIVPEPAMLALFGLGLFGLGISRRRRA